MSYPSTEFSLLYEEYTAHARKHLSRDIISVVLAQLKKMVLPYI